MKKKSWDDTGRVSKTKTGVPYFVPSSNSPHTYPKTTRFHPDDAEKLLNGDIVEITAHIQKKSQQKLQIKLRKFVRRGIDQGIGKICTDGIHLWIEITSKNEATPIILKK